VEVVEHLAHLLSDSLKPVKASHARSNTGPRQTSQIPRAGSSRREVAIRVRAD
jgi:hypothetical protein